MQRKAQSIDPSLARHTADSSLSPSSRRINGRANSNARSLVLFLRNFPWEAAYARPCTPAPILSLPVSPSHSIKRKQNWLMKIVKQNKARSAVGTSENRDENTCDLELVPGKWKRARMRVASLTRPTLAATPCRRDVLFYIMECVTSRTGTLFDWLILVPDLYDLAWPRVSKP
jgi:hypothetical protein